MASPGPGTDGTSRGLPREGKAGFSSRARARRGRPLEGWKAPASPGDLSGPRGPRRVLGSDGAGRPPGGVVREASEDVRTWRRSSIEGAGAAPDVWFGVVEHVDPGVGGEFDALDDGEGGVAGPRVLLGGIVVRD